MNLENIKKELADRYLIEREIGRGAMGTVYYATSVRNPSAPPVAVKVFVPESDSTRERFRAEIATVARLNHPNILSIVDSGESADFLFHVTPFVTGKSVDHMLGADAQLSVRDALVICERVVSALDFAHAHGVIHRDIKPGNVIVPHEGGVPRFDRVLLADFGMVGLLAPETSATQIGQVFGTPLYMSPEQVQAQAQTAATDVYGVGALLFRMIFGRPPFRGDNLLELMVRIKNAPVEIPREPELPAALTDFLVRCLDKNPHRRPRQLAREIETLLGRVEHTTRVVAGPPASTVPDAGLLGRTLHPSPYSIPAPSRVTTAKLHAPGTYGVAAGVVLLLVALASFVAMQPELGPAASGIALAVTLMVGGIAVGLLVHRWIARVKSGLHNDASRVLDIATAHADLSSSLALEVNQLLARCRGLDEQFLGKSIAIMVNEYRAATSFDDRHAALVTAVGFVEKLSTRLSPWYVRYDKLIAFVVSAVGVASGLVTMIDTLLKMN